MGVVISPNIKKQATRIDINGNEIDPKTKRVIKKNEETIVPTVAPEVPQENAKPVSKIEQMIQEKIEKAIEDKITQILDKIL